MTKQKGINIWFVIVIVILVILISSVGFNFIHDKFTKDSYSSQQEVKIPPVSNPSNSNDAKLLNQATDFLRSCILNCPKECPSCGVFSLSCVKSCSDSARSKVNNRVFSDAEINNLLTDRNLKWNACMTPCDTSDSVGDYIDIACLQGCGS